MKKCYGCQVELPLDKFGSDKSRSGGKSTYCLECRAEKARISRRLRPHVNRNYNLKTKYGVSPEWYKSKLAEQNGVCDICGTDKPGGRGKDLFVDHNHATNEVRGLLCSNCNTMLGYAKDNPKLLELGAIYLRKYEGNA